MSVEPEWENRITNKTLFNHVVPVNLFMVIWLSFTMRGLQNIKDIIHKCYHFAGQYISKTRP
jgi:hypothetical protein